MLLEGMIIRQCEDYVKETDTLIVRDLYKCYVNAKYVGTLKPCKLKIGTRDAINAYHTITTDCGEKVYFKEYEIEKWRRAEANQ